MNSQYKLLVAMFLVFAASACANPQTTELEKPAGDPYIFVFSDESKVFNIAYHALAREVDSELIKELNGPVRGFYARKESWGGNSNYWIRIFAANGADQNGRNTYGYYGEVMVEGDKGTERESAKNIFSDMEAVLAQQGRKVFVRNLTRAKYRDENIGNYRSGGGYNFEAAPRQEPRVADSPAAASAPGAFAPDPAPAEPARGEYVPAQRPSAPGDSSSGSLSDELLRLNELREKGILSDEEFQRAKEKILNQ